MTTTRRAMFPADGDPYCTHRSHYECVACGKLVCARCGAEMQASSDDWKAIGYWCSGCLKRKAEEVP